MLAVGMAAVAVDIMVVTAEIMQPMLIEEAVAVLLLYRDMPDVMR